MKIVTCETCHGSGRLRQGELVSGIDFRYDFSRGFTLMMCSTRYEQAAYKTQSVVQCVALLKSLRPGKKVVSRGHTRTVLEVGMYDGAPFWEPTPAVSYIDRRGHLVYEFYFDLSAVPRRGAHRKVGASPADEQLGLGTTS